MKELTNLNKEIMSEKKRKNRKEFEIVELEKTDDFSDKPIITVTIDSDALARRVMKGTGKLLKRLLK